MDATKDQVTAFLKEWTAAERAADATALEDLLTDDFVGVGPLGFTLTRADWLDRHRTGDLTYDTFDVDEVDIRAHGDAAVVVARHTAAGNYRGHPIPESVRATLVVTNDEGISRLAGIHFSFIAGTPGAPPRPGPPPAAAPTPEEGA